MNALRTLPILNRPSRPSSPAPPSTTTTPIPGTIPKPSDGNDKPRSRSLSRQITDKVSHLNLSGVPANTNGSGTILTSQPLGKAKGPTPPGTRPGTPRIAGTPLPGTPVGDPNGAPQSGYMDVLGLRLNEAVNKACTGVDYKAKKGFKKGSGWSVGEAVVKELPYPPSDAYLIRAVLRTAVRSLSIYITRLESLLLPSLTDPTFNNPLNLIALSVNAHPLNPAQYFAVTIAHTAWETCEVLEQTLETGKWPRFVQETLRPVMDKFDLVVGKVIQPITLGLKRDLVASLGRTEGTSPPGGKVIGLASIPAPNTDVPLAKEHSNAPVGRVTKEVSQQGRARTVPIPTCLQHFASRVDGARKVLEIVAAPCADDGEGWITGIMVAVIWKGMCLVSEKNIGAHAARPPSPSSVSRALYHVSRSDTTPAVVASPSLGGVTAKFTTMLPSRAASRPPSPPRRAGYDPMTHTLVSLEGLIKRLVGGLVQPPAAVAPSADDPNITEHIAREAMHEALEALESFRIISAAMHSRDGSSRLLSSVKRVRDGIDIPEEEELDDAIEDLPAVTLFSIILRQANHTLSQIINEDEKLDLHLKLPIESWNMSVGEYESKVLSGFGTAEEWGRRFVLAIKGEVERVLEGLEGIKGGSGVEGEKRGVEVREAEEWVRALGLAGEGRFGVKVGGC